MHSVEYNRRARLREAGRLCSAYDIDYDGVWMDMNSPQGYINALYQVMRLRPGASLTLAPVCSTWVFMNLGSGMSVITV